MRLGVVIPLANEAGSVSELLTRVLRHLTTADAVFCVVDQASRDRTREIVESWSNRSPQIRLVWAPENRCVVDAYFRGYRAALDAGCQWVLEMDGGLSHQPEEIPRFVRAMKRGYDYVGGSRFLRGGSHSGSLHRWLVSKVGGVLANRVLGTCMTDMTGGFECFNRRALEAVVAHGARSRAHFFQTEIKFLLRDWHWTEVPITYRNPSKRLALGSLKEALRNLWRLRRESGEGSQLLQADPIETNPAIRRVG